MIELYFNLQDDQSTITPTYYVKSATLIESDCEEEKYAVVESHHNSTPTFGDMLKELLKDVQPIYRFINPNLLNQFNHADKVSGVLTIEWVRFELEEEVGYFEIKGEFNTRTAVNSQYTPTFRCDDYEDFVNAINKIAYVFGETPII